MQPTQRISVMTNLVTAARALSSGQHSADLSEAVGGPFVALIESGLLYEDLS